jgi:hypothetical protein
MSIADREPFQDEPFNPDLARFTTRDLILEVQIRAAKNYETNKGWNDIGYYTKHFLSGWFPASVMEYKPGDNS